MVALQHFPQTSILHIEQQNEDLLLMLLMRNLQLVLGLAISTGVFGVGRMRLFAGEVSVEPSRLFGFNGGRGGKLTIRVEATAVPCMSMISWTHRIKKFRRLVDFGCFWVSL